MERTFVLIKPDGVQTGIVGEAIRRFERAGLRIAALKLVRPTPELIRKHYPNTDEWFATAGNKSRDTYAKLGMDVKKELGTDDPVKIGKIVKDWLVRFNSSGPVVAMVLEGNRAIEMVRKLVGPTLPNLAPPGTIRGDFSTDSADVANREQRPVRNLVHASGDAGEAKNEIALWFRKDELA